MSSAMTTFEKTVRDMADELIQHAQANGTSASLTDVEISIGRTQETSVQIEGGEPSMTEKGSVMEISINMYAGNKKISFRKDAVNMDALKKAIDDNLQVLALLPENPDVRLADSKDLAPATVEDLDLDDKHNVSIEEMVDYALDVEKAIMAQDKIKATRSVSVSRYKQRTYHRATNGIDHYKSRTMHSAGAQVIAEENGKMEAGYEYISKRHFSDMPKAETLGRDAAKDAVGRLNSEQLETADYPIVLDNDTAANFFGTVMQAISGSAVYKKSTVLQESLGKQILPSEVTIEDDPTLERGLGSYSVDAAGLKAEKMTFIENGVVKSYVLGLHSARKLGMKPIGRENGLSNTRVLPGSQSRDELIANIKKGILVKGFNGGTVNLQNGTFSRPAYGVLIENGKITDKPVSGFIVACGDLKEVFKNVSIANDTPAQPSSKYRFAAPTTRLHGMTVSGK